jgi:hypothetical protein
MKGTLFVLTLSLLLSPAAVKADAISVTGQATLVAPPPDATAHTGAATLGFDEQSLTLSSPLAVEISTPGSYASLASLTPGTIAAGTAVSSFYVHSFGPDISGNVFSGSITFSTPILGVDALAAGLVATNFLGAPTTTYSTTDVGQSFEFGSQIDSLTISADRLTLTFLNETFNAPDDLRIITANTATATPEPSGLLLLGVGLMALIPSATLISKARSRITLGTASTQKDLDHA